MSQQNQNKQQRFAQQQQLQIQQHQQLQLQQWQHAHVGSISSGASTVSGANLHSMFTNNSGHVPSAVNAAGVRGVAPLLQRHFSEGAAGGLAGGFDLEMRAHHMSMSRRHSSLGVAATPTFDAFFPTHQQHRQQEHQQQQRLQHHHQQQLCQQQQQLRQVSYASQTQPAIQNIKIEPFELPLSAADEENIEHDINLLTPTVEMGEINIKTEPNAEDSYKMNFAQNDDFTYENYPRHTQQHAAEAAEAAIDMNSGKLEQHIKQEPLAANAQQKGFNFPRRKLQTERDTLPICQRCKQVFLKKPSYIKHVAQSACDIVEYDCKCAICPMSFMSNEDLHMHEQVHRAQKYFCHKYCGKYFDTIELCEVHEYMQHDYPSFVCNFCAATFVTREQLFAHMPQHRHQPRYDCPVCRVWFQNARELHQHRSAAPFYCGKYYSAKERSSSAPQSRSTFPTPHTPASHNPQNYHLQECRMGVMEAPHSNNRHAGLPQTRQSSTMQASGSNFFQPPVPHIKTEIKRENDYYYPHEFSQHNFNDFMSDFGNSTLPYSNHNSHTNSSSSSNSSRDFKDPSHSFNFAGLGPSSASTSSANTHNTNSLSALRHTSLDGDEVCSVPKCGTSKSTSPSLQFFSFPKDEKYLLQWLHNLKMFYNAQLNYNNYRICSLHFPKRCINRYSLCYWAVPTFNLGHDDVANLYQNREITNTFTTGELARCSMPSCSSQRGESNFKFYNFPNETKSLIKWCQNARLPVYAKEPRHFCSRHFEDRCFGKFRLKPWAVPTLHLGNPYGKIHDNPGVFYLEEKKCCLPHCRRTRSSDFNLSLYRFPRDEVLLRRWCYNLRLDPGIYRGKNHKICSAHFVKEALGLRKLSPGAVPTLNLGHSDTFNIYENELYQSAPPAPIQSLPAPHSHFTGSSPSAKSFKFHNTSMSSLNYASMSMSSMDMAGSRSRSASTSTIASNNNSAYDSIDVCCVPKCKHNRHTKNVTLHTIPRRPEQLQKWAHNLKMDMERLQHKALRICSAHFETYCIGGCMRPFAVPTLNLGHEDTNIHLNPDNIKKLNIRETCCVQSCKRNRDRDHANLHRFPANPTQLQKWCENLKKPVPDGSKLFNDAICEVHFEDRCLRNKRLEKWSLPTLKLGHDDIKHQLPTEAEVTEFWSKPSAPNIGDEEGDCCVESCKRNPQVDDIKLYRVPDDAEVLAKWVHNLQLDDINQQLSSLRICNLHFEAHCFGKKRLHSWALPTLNLGKTPENLFENPDDLRQQLKESKLQKLHDPMKSYAPRCCLPHCRKMRGIDSVQLYRFPHLNRKTLAKWCHNLQMPLVGNMHRRICSAHFEPQVLTKRCPVQLAVPTLDLNAPAGYKLYQNPARLKVNRLRQDVCLIPSCRKTRADGVQLFRFPHNHGLRRKWQHNTHQNANEAIRSNLRICSRHFEPHSFGTKRLSPGAIPTLHLGFDDDHIFPNQAQTFAEQQCIVKDCAAFKDGDNVRLFKFPTDEDLLWKWCNNLKMNPVDCNGVRICNKHFEEECIGDRKKVLLKWAIPTLKLGHTDPDIELIPIPTASERNADVKFKCCVPTCGKTREFDIAQLNSFPKNVRLFQRWKHNLQLLHLAFKDRPKYKICNDHFEDICLGKNRLNYGAIPTLNLGHEKTIDLHKVNPTQIQTKLFCTPAPFKVEKAESDSEDEEEDEEEQENEREEEEEDDEEHEEQEEDEDDEDENVSKEDASGSTKHKENDGKQVKEEEQQFQQEEENSTDEEEDLTEQEDKEVDSSEEDEEEEENEEELDQVQDKEDDYEGEEDDEEDSDFEMAILPDNPICTNKCSYPKCSASKSLLQEVYSLPQQIELLKLWHKEMQVETNEKLQVTKHLCGLHFINVYQSTLQAANALLAEQSELENEMQELQAAYERCANSPLICSAQCSVAGCSSNQLGTHKLYSFPHNANNGPELVQKWCFNTGVQLPEEGEEEKLNFTIPKVCAKHFDQRCFHDDQRLKFWAVPTLQLKHETPEKIFNNPVDPVDPSEPPAVEQKQCCISACYAVNAPFKLFKLPIAPGVREKWLDNLKKPPILIQSHGVCRVHFEPQCFSGDSLRIWAVPTLNFGPEEELIHQNPAVHMLSAETSRKWKADDDDEDDAELALVKVKNSLDTIKCVVSTCQKSRLQDGVRLFPFPTSSAMTKKWCHNLKLSYSIVNKRPYICNLHFHKRCIEGKQLRQWAKPTKYLGHTSDIFDNPKNLPGIFLPICCLPHCRKRRTLDNDLRTFGFPKSQELHRKWCDNLQMTPTASQARLCMDHFESEVMGQRKLRSGAVPTLNLGHNKLLKYNNKAILAHIGFGERQQHGIGDAPHMGMYNNSAIDYSFMDDDYNEDLSYEGVEKDGIEEQKGTTHTHILTNDSDADELDEERVASNAMSYLECVVEEESPLLNIKKERAVNNITPICCLKHCRKQKTPEQHLSTFGFPKDPGLLQKWADNLRLSLEDCVGRVCIEHFELRVLGSRRLRTGAVPTLNLGYTEKPPYNNNTNFPAGVIEVVNERMPVNSSLKIEQVSSIAEMESSLEMEPYINIEPIVSIEPVIEMEIPDEQTNNSDQFAASLSENSISPAATPYATNMNQSVFRLCCLKHCRRKRATVLDDHIRTFGFPKNETLFRKWCENLRLPPIYCRRRRLCVAHFEPGVVGKQKLFPGAMPTLDLGHDQVMHQNSASTLNYVAANSKVCNVPGCGRVGKRLFRFPHKLKPLALWCAQLKLELQPEICGRYKICERHFEPALLGSVRLPPGALPTLHLPRSNTLTNTNALHASNTCCVPTCRRVGVQLYSFPKGQTILVRKWYHNTKHSQSQQAHAPRPRICAAHFELQALLHNGHPQPWAVPTLKLGHTDAIFQNPRHKLQEAKEAREVHEATQKCCLKHCQAPESVIRLYSYPKRGQLLRQWAHNTQQDAYLAQRRDYKVCAQHFSPACFADDQSLKEDAVPTLDLGQALEHINKPNLEKSMQTNTDLCSLPHCGRSVYIDGVRLYRFPLGNEELLAKWCHNLQTDAAHSAQLQICNLHFEPGCLYKRQLHNWAIPTLFLGQTDTIYQNSVEELQTEQAKSPVDGKLKPTDYCCVIGCGKNRTDNVRLHSFPKQCFLNRRWTHNLKLSSTSRLLKFYKVCELHFEPYCQGPKHLKCGAVPTLLLGHDDNNIYRNNRAKLEAMGGNNKAFKVENSMSACRCAVPQCCAAQLLHMPLCKLPDEEEMSARWCHYLQITEAKTASEQKLCALHFLRAYEWHARGDNDENQNCMDKSTENNILNERVQAVYKAISKSTRLLSHKCCVHGCKSDVTNDQTQLFPYPNNEQLRAKWLHNTQVELPKKWHGQHVYKVCALHFEENCFIKWRTTRLQPWALPTLKLPISSTEIYQLPTVQEEAQLKSCCVANCKVSNSSENTAIKYFKFPRYTSNEVLTKWCHNLQLTATEIDTSTLRICSRHFECCCIHKQRLRAWALPTLELPAIVAGESNACKDIFQNPAKESAAVVCSVESCRQIVDHDAGVYLYPFPHHDEVLSKQWVHNLQAAVDSDCCYARVCTLHFEPQCIARGGKRLRKGALPTRDLGHNSCDISLKKFKKEKVGFEKCLVCGSAPRLRHKQLYRLPQEAATLHKWRHNLRLTAEALQAPKLRVCEDHFEPYCFIVVQSNESTVKKLQPWALPTVNLHQAKEDIEENGERGEQALVEPDILRNEEINNAENKTSEVYATTKCAILSCEQTERLFNFPRTQLLRQKWCENTLLPLTLAPYLKICAAHFEPRSFGSRKLHAWAMPTLHLGQQCAPQHMNVNPKEFSKYQLKWVCAISTCGKSKKHQDDNVQLFRYPKNRRLCYKWAENCKHEVLQIMRRKYRICSAHFESNCFNGKHLRFGSVPTLNLGHTDALLHGNEHLAANRLHCHVPKCSRNKKDDGVRLFKFPVNTEVVAKWCHNLQMHPDACRDALICHMHFERHYLSSGRLLACSLPTLNLGHDSTDIYHNLDTSEKAEMLGFCNVLHCGKTKNRDNVVLSRFPKNNPLMCGKWSRNLKLPISVDVWRTFRVCSAHFEDYCYENGRLICGSVPTLNLGHSDGAKHHITKEILKKKRKKLTPANGLPEGTACEDEMCCYPDCFVVLKTKLYEVPDILPLRLGWLKSMNFDKLNAEDDEEEEEAETLKDSSQNEILKELEVGKKKNMETLLTEEALESHNKEENDKHCKEICPGTFELCKEPNEIETVQTVVLKQEEKEKGEEEAEAEERLNSELKTLEVCEGDNISKHDAIRDAEMEQSEQKKCKIENVESRDQQEGNEISGISLPVKMAEPETDEIEYDHIIEELNKNQLLKSAKLSSKNDKLYLCAVHYKVTYDDNLLMLENLSVCSAADPKMEQKFKNARDTYRIVCDTPRVRSVCCAVEGCGTNTLKQEPYRLYPLPCNRDLLEKWCHNTKIVLDERTYVIRVCQLHFESFCFGETTTRRLKYWAIPTLKLPQADDREIYKNPTAEVRERKLTPRKCCIRTCINAQGDLDATVTLQHFPRELCLLNKWLYNTQVSRRDVFSARICGLHFEPHCIKKRVCNWAVPTLQLGHDLPDIYQNPKMLGVEAATPQSLPNAIKEEYRVKMEQDDKSVINAAQVETAEIIIKQEPLDEEFLLEPIAGNYQDSFTIKSEILSGDEPEAEVEAESEAPAQMGYTLEQRDEYPWMPQADECVEYGNDNSNPVAAGMRNSRHCQIVNCNGHADMKHIILHKFPIPEDQFQKWIHNTQINVHREFRWKYRICNRHFEKECFRGKRLQYGSMPTLKLGPNKPDAIYENEFNNFPRSDNSDNEAAYEDMQSEALEYVAANEDEGDEVDEAFEPSMLFGGNYAPNTDTEHTAEQEQPQSKELHVELEVQHVEDFQEDVYRPPEYTGNAETLYPPKLNKKRTCAIVGCYNRSDQPGITLHKFPMPEGLFRKWVHNTQIDVDRDCRWRYKICCRHFELECFRGNRLASGTMPTLNLGPNRPAQIYQNETNPTPKAASAHNDEESLPAEELHAVRNELLDDTVDSVTPPLLTNYMDLSMDVEETDSQSMVKSTSSISKKTNHRVEDALKRKYMQEFDMNMSGFTADESDYEYTPHESTLNLSNNTRHCRVPGCKSHSGQPGVKMHKFPLPEDLFQKWMHNTQVKVDRNCRWKYKICGRHFEPGCLNGRRFVTGTMPTLHLGPKRPAKIYQNEFSLQGVGATGLEDSREYVSDNEDSYDVPTTSKKLYDDENSVPELSHFMDPTPARTTRKIAADESNSLLESISDIHSADIEIDLDDRSHTQFAQASPVNKKRLCAIENCNTYGDQELGISLHKFPTDAKHFAKWEHNTQLAVDKDTRWKFKICNRHFEPACFRGKRLLPGTMPTLHLGPHTPKNIYKSVFVKHNTKPRAKQEEDFEVEEVEEELYNNETISPDFVETDNANADCFVARKETRPSIKIKEEFVDATDGGSPRLLQTSPKDIVYNEIKSGYQKCSLMHCQKQMSKDHVKTFKFPKMCELQEKWSHNLRIQYDAQRPWKYIICSDHFEKVCFVQQAEEGKVQLHPWAVPTLNLGTNIPSILFSNGKDNLKLQARDKRPQSARKEDEKEEEEQEEADLIDVTPLAKRLRKSVQDASYTYDWSDWVETCGDPKRKRVNFGCIEGKKKCSLPHCQRERGEGNKLFRFPMDAETIAKWERNLRMDYSASQRNVQRICSSHFEPYLIGVKRLLKGALPTLNLGHNSKDIFKNINNGFWVPEGDPDDLFDIEPDAPHCHVPSCGSTQQKEDSGRPSKRLFKFPIKLSWARSWQTRLQIDYEPYRRDTVYVCEAHFQPADIQDGELVPEALPSRNLPYPGEGEYLYQLLWSRLKQERDRETNVCGSDSSATTKSATLLRCSVRQCQNSTDTPGIKMFAQFPDDLELFSKWCHNLQIDNRKYVPGTYNVCSVHFESYCIGGHSLRLWAIPTLNLGHSAPPDYLHQVQRPAEMETICCLPHCRRRKSKDGVRFYNFPKGDSYKLWCHLLQLDEALYRDASKKICSVHFKSTAFVGNSLKPGAKPSLLLTRLQLPAEQHQLDTEQQQTQRVLNKHFGVKPAKAHNAPLITHPSISRNHSARCCVVPSCSETRILFQFPEKRNLYVKWCHNLKIDYTLKTHKYTPQHTICQRHFEPHCLRNLKLHAEAIPTLHLGHNDKNIFQNAASFATQTTITTAAAAATPSGTTMAPRRGRPPNTSGNDLRDEDMFLDMLLPTTHLGESGTADASSVDASFADFEREHLLPHTSTFVAADRGAIIDLEDSADEEQSQEDDLTDWQPFPANKSKNALK